MPKQDERGKKAEVQQAVASPPVVPDAIEATYFLGGLFTEFQTQVSRYTQLTREVMKLQAQIEVNEKTLCVVRDHLAISIEKIDSAMPHDWRKVLDSVRFVGCRLAEACVELLKTNQRMTPNEILKGLNLGMFRFRTNAPLREIHGALLRQPSIKRDGEHWVYVAEQQVSVNSADGGELDGDNEDERPGTFV